MGEKLVLLFDHWVGFDLSEAKNPSTKAHIKLFNDGYTQREDDVAMLAWVCVDTCTLNEAVKLNTVT